MATYRTIIRKLTLFILFKFPLLDALSLLMLFAERASKESVPPVNPKLVYVYLIACIGCGVTMSGKFKLHFACLLYSGQLLLFAINVYTNPAWQYPHWQRVLVACRQIGCMGIYIMLGSMMRKNRSEWLHRIGEGCLGLYLLSYVYLINSIPEYKNGFHVHMFGGDYMRFLIALTLAACGLSFFSGSYLRDMSICTAITLILTTVFVDLDIRFWMSQGVHQWIQIRQVMNCAAIVVGFLMLWTSVDNRLKIE